MELRNIISFLKVQELSSFSKAAEALGYTQSNISSHIHQLEKELKHPLFDRLGRNIYLTEYGPLFSHMLSRSSILLNRQNLLSVMICPIRKKLKSAY